MTEMEIPVIDVYTFTMKFIPEGYIDHVYYNNEVRKKKQLILQEISAIREL